MATQQAAQAIVIVNSSNQIITPTGTSATTRQPQMAIRVVNSSGTVVVPIGS